ncbi:MAG: UDP-N-acetylglucosamine 1-carboxyvinyltransferase [Candidatus Berkelbacteria bacterium]|nr:UDP-N-acetylglucosamine 1-carboxyvinyltransferase [Candidatus Berkelbacteria bacterium]
MAKFQITGQQKLNGDFKVSGAKNAALKMVAAAVMIPGVTTLHNIPKIVDIERMVDVIKSLGAKVEYTDHTLVIDATNVKSFSPDETPIKKLRGSVVIIGPLLARFGKAHFSEPGGCLIGSRPIDTHLKAFEAIDVSIEISDKGEKFFLQAGSKFKKGDIEVVLSEMSVTATENIMMAAVLRNGKTIIKIAACEPEIVDLANFLNQAGAKISDAGNHTIIIEGVKKLNDVEYTVMPDRIEAGTMVIAAAVCGGRVKIMNIIPDHLALVFSKFNEMSIDYEIIPAKNNHADIIINQRSQLVAPVSAKLDVRQYPGLPTDLQAPLAVLATQAKGETRIFETLFNSRFDYTKWLVEMGAKIDILNPFLIEINGPSLLHGREIESSDIRGGAALVIAALCARGTTIINNVEYIDRGYEDFDLRLKKLGAEIERID